MACKNCEERRRGFDVWARFWELHGKRVQIKHCKISQEDMQVAIKTACAWIEGKSYKVFDGVKLRADCEV
jgi:hypothetical protein